MKLNKSQNTLVEFFPNETSINELKNELEETINIVSKNLLLGVAHSSVYGLSLILKFFLEEYRIKLSSYACEELFASVFHHYFDERAKLIKLQLGVDSLLTLTKKSLKRQKPKMLLKFNLALLQALEKT